MERVQHRGGLRELVADRVGVALEWVQRGRADLSRGGLALTGRPAAVSRPGAALHQVQHPGSGLALLVAGVVHDLK